MASPNYRFDKRQRELAKQKKKEEKRLKREAGKNTGEGSPPVTPAEGSGG